jgi:hypothetical protein
VTTSNAGSVGGAEPESLEQQLRRKRVKPIGSADDLACDGLFETDAELEEFLAYTYAARRAEVA